MPNGARLLLQLIFLTAALLVPCGAEAQLLPEESTIYRITVTKAADPKSVMRKNIACPKLLDGGKLVGKGKFGAGAHDELVLEREDGTFEIRRLGEPPCAEAPTALFPGMPSFTYIGNADRDGDGIEELWFASHDRSELKVFHRIGDGFELLSSLHPGALDPRHTDPPRVLQLPGGVLGLAAIAPSTLSVFLLTAPRKWIPIPIPYRTEHISGVIDGDGDGVQELLLWNGEGPARYSRFGLLPRTLTVMHQWNWAEFPFTAPAALLPGDYDGDGRTEVLAQLPGVAGLWMAATTPQGAIEFPLSGGRLEDDLSKGIVGDFDGDGDEEAVFGTRAQALTLLELPRAPVFPGVEVQVNGRTAGVSAQDGSIVLTAGRTATFAAVAPGKERRSIAKTVRGREGEVTLVRLVVVDESSARDDGSVYGNTADLSGPRVCLGYEPTVLAARWVGVARQCPEQHGIFSIDDSNFKGSRMECCRLPQDDILTAEQLFHSEECPDGYVVTGMPDALTPEPESKFRCTKINSERYRLSAPLPGRYWGAGHSRRSFRSATAWHELPAAIRYSVGRLTAASWDADGCIGDTPGALFVGGLSKDCSQRRFRVLLENSTGSPVRMFRSCGRIENYADPRSGCTEPERQAHTSKARP